MQDAVMNNEFWQCVANIEHYFDTSADVLDDDALFAAGYLQGHFAVVVSRLQTAEASVEMLDEAMQQNLTQAFAAGELEKADQALVETLWQKIFQMHQ